MRAASGAVEMGSDASERLRGHAPDERVLVVEPQNECIDCSRSGVDPEPLGSHISDVVPFVVEQGEEGGNNAGIADPAEGFGRAVAHDP